MYSYCFNNPVNMSAPDGNWPGWANKIFNKVKQAVTSTVNKVKKFVSKHVGTAVNVGKEKTTYKQYYGVATYESGVGYNKSFATGKSVNVYINIPENPFEIWEYAGGIDVNINGKGFSLQKGAENAIAIHMKSNSFELGTNVLGRVYGKHTYASGDSYAYNKLSMNFPEMVAVAAVVMYAPGVAGATGTAGQLFNYSNKKRIG